MCVKDLSGMGKGGLKAVGWGEEKEVEEKARKKKCGNSSHTASLDLFRSVVLFPLSRATKRQISALC